MSRHHDRASRSPATASAAERPLARASESHAPASSDGAPPKDVLSDVLRAVRLTGALFFRVEASSPWVMEMPDGATLARDALPGAQHVISYHVVTRGSCRAGVTGADPVTLEAGDVVAFPHGDPYVMSMPPGLCGGPSRAEIQAFMRAMAAGQLPATVVEGGGGPERLHLVCGFLGCDVRPFNPLLAALPRLLHLPRAPGAAGDALEHLLQLTLAESGERRAGGECVRLRLSEVLFVELVRRHLAMLSAEQTGWLSGLRDPAVGRALTRLHERPAHPWTLEELARDVGLSRSAFAERFAHFVGRPPMQYLTHWRMQVAARLLAEGEAKVLAVAAEVGYDSEAAFSRAFKRIAGVPPAAWRTRRTGLA